MKKLRGILSILVCLALAASLSACTGDKGNEPTSSVSSAGHSVNIMAYASQGRIPEISYALGDDIEHLKETFADTLEPDSEIEGLFEDEGEKTVWLDGGSVLFCYEKAKKEAGIAAIVAKEYAYDFSLGGVYEAEDIIAAAGDAAYTRAEATKEDAFFLPIIPESCECITYQAGEYILRFILINGYLSAVTLTNPANWG